MARTVIAAVDAPLQAKISSRCCSHAGIQNGTVTRCRLCAAVVAWAHPARRQYRNLTFHPLNLVRILRYHSMYTHVNVNLHYGQC